jgi:hypothetical protein
MKDALESPLPAMSERQVPGLRRETVRILRAMVATTAITEGPVNLTRDEARLVLDLAEQPWIIPSSWVRALVSGFRYTVIAARQARRAGFVEYADWLESTRSQPISEIIAGLRPEWWTGRTPLSPPSGRSE